MDTHCPKCGLAYVMVGKAHNCRMANAPEPMANEPDDMANTYRYRDKGKRRSYMKDYMRKKRGSEDK
jgi:hypothetical protein